MNTDRKKKSLTTDDLDVDSWNKVNAQLGYRLTSEGSEEDLHDVRDEIYEMIYEGDDVVYFPTEFDEDLEIDHDATEENCDQDTLEALQACEAHLYG